MLLESSPSQPLLVHLVEMPGILLSPEVVDNMAQSDHGVLDDESLHQQQTTTGNIDAINIDDDDLAVLHLSEFLAYAELTDHTMAEFYVSPSSMSCMSSKD